MGDDGVLGVDMPVVCIGEGWGEGARELAGCVPGREDTGVEVVDGVALAGLLEDDAWGVGEGVEGDTVTRGVDV